MLAEVVKSEIQTPMRIKGGRLSAMMQVQTENGVFGAHVYHMTLTFVEAEGVIEYMMATVYVCQIRNNHYGHSGGGWVTLIECGVSCSCLHGCQNHADDLYVMECTCLCGPLNVHHHCRGEGSSRGNGHNLLPDNNHLLWSGHGGVCGVEMVSVYRSLGVVGEVGNVFHHRD